MSDSIETAVDQDLAKERIGRVFKFLQEFHKLRTPPISHLDQYEWKLELASLPSYPTIKIGKQSTKSDEGDDSEPQIDDFVLKISRPNETPCPAPPSVISEWVKNGWQKIDALPEFISAKNRTESDGRLTVERFEDDPRRTEEYNRWTKVREDWKQAEAPVREAVAIFSEFFSLWGRFERESEKYQLFIGDGVLNWASGKGPVVHPMLLQKLELIFEPRVPEFILREADSDPQLYTALLRHHEADGRAIHQTKLQLIHDQPHPLGAESTDAFFKFFIQRFFNDGEFVSKGAFPAKPDAPHIYRSPILYLGLKNQGFVDALEAFVDNIESLKEVPKVLARVVGVGDQHQGSAEGSDGGDNSYSTLSAEDLVEPLLTKAANKEQERIIQRLASTGSVLVQGPPGTGKSHTIANLVGHLLAQNKTILITSHTAKALRVVREKVAKPLQPLCVAVLENDEESRKQLEESVVGIVNYFSRTDKSKLKSEIASFAKKRAELKTRLSALRNKVLEAQRYEYEDVVVAGEGTPPSKAARRLVELAGVHDWIPGPVTPSAAVPLTSGDLAKLYASNKVISAEDERVLEDRLPSVDLLPTPQLLSDHWKVRGKLEKMDRSHGADLWLHSKHSPDELEKLMTEAMLLVQDLAEDGDWFLECIEAGRKGEPHRELWDSLINLVMESQAKISKNQELILTHGPRLVTERPVKESLRICNEIIARLESGGSLGFFSTMLKGEWKEFIAAAKIDEGSPTNVQHFHALQAHIEVLSLRADIVRRWERQVTAQGGPKVQELGDRPETVAFHYVPRIARALDWFDKVWLPIEARLTGIGLNWPKLKAKAVAKPSPYAELIQIREAILNGLGPVVAAKHAQYRLDLLRRTELNWLGELKGFSEKSYAFNLVQGLADAIKSGNVDGYHELWTRLGNLTVLSSAHAERKQLLLRLESAAPGWAHAIRNRRSPHDQDAVPGDVLMAWKFRQWEQILSDRSHVDLDSLQREMSEAKHELQDVTAQYVESLAWSAQHERMGLREQQALTGWLQLQRRMKSKTSIRYPRLQREARKMLESCKAAVPVWIMPVSRVIEDFDLSRTKFDVVIVDEASQSDIRALATFALGNEIVVVGDHEQVSPYAVGQQLAPVQALIDEILIDVPNNQLYDGRLSIYDMARMSFGETIRLVEHFRCVPDIIQFSNHLCYEGSIRPLREASSSSLVPHLVCHRVSGGESVNKVNQKEALEVSSLIAAMAEMPEYEGASIGVVSLLGEEQAMAISEILQRRLPVDVYQRHRILCGTASQFQGDERSVMFLSMVHSPTGGPLPLIQSDDPRKVYNVAASRAQDQMWIVHSLNPETDLKPNDLRLRLIKHAQDPSALRQQILEAENLADSEFEKLVIADLTNAGFRLRPQWEVGAYRIDIVVLGENDQKVAIECDGDRFHPPEKLEADLERQMILERLKWRFIRIRGSEYFRNREFTMKRVISRLHDLGILPLGAEMQKDHGAANEELRLKVVRRAEEIRKGWEENPIADADDDAPKRRRGRWGKSTDARSKEEKKSPASEQTSSEVPVSQKSSNAQNAVPIEQARANEGWSISQDLYKNIVRWNDQAKKMTNSVEKRLMGRLESAAYFISKGRKVDESMMKEAVAAVERAVYLGFDPKRSY